MKVTTIMKIIILIMTCSWRYCERRNLQKTGYKCWRGRGGVKGVDGERRMVDSERGMKEGWGVLEGKGWMMGVRRRGGRWWVEGLDGWMLVNGGRMEEW